MGAALLELEGIGKRFPGVTALENVSMTVGCGEVVALIGENGAGKSTLMKILGGVQAADSGTIRWEGRPVALRSVGDATRLGIGFVHQELNVLDNLDVAGNLFLGREPVLGPFRLLDRKRMEAESEGPLHRLGLPLNPRTPLRELSLAQRQLVEIARALAQDARLLILDEPTSSLTRAETERLLETIAELRGQGVSVIYISHRLGEIERCADRVVALRDGRNAGELCRDEISHDRMVRLMVGRDLKALYVPPAGEARALRMEVRGMRTMARPRQTVNLEVFGGEILGIAGLVGAGRSELAQAIFGVDPAVEGEIRLDGRALAIGSPRDAIDAGIYLIPEDRRRTGLITDLTIRENITLPGLERYATASLVRRGWEKRAALKQLQALRIKAPSVEARVGDLSGGNQQKVVLARWMSLDPKVLIFDEPTRGIDVGAREEIYRLMRDLADRGVAILMISSDMEEVLGVSDRVAVMHEGAISGVLDRSRLSEEAVMDLCVGVTAAA